MEYIKLDGFVELSQGLCVNQKTAPLFSDKKTNEFSYPLLKIANMQSNTFDMFVSKDVNTKVIANKDDLIYTRTGLVGYCFKGFNGVVHNNSFIINITKPHLLDKNYLYIVLNSNDVREQAIKMARNSVQPDLTHDMFKSLIIPLPNITIQRKIVDIILNIDNQIKRNNDMVQKLQVLAQSTYSRWFNQFEFPNEDGLPYKSNGGQLVYNEELKREIPIGWEVKELDSILKESDKSQIQVGEAKQNIGTYPFFTSGEEIVLYKDAFVNGAYCYLNTGGNADVKFFDGKASYSTDTWCISFDEYTYIMKEYLQSIKLLMDKLFFSGSGLKHLQKEAFKKQKVLIPPLNLVLAYNDIVSDCQKQASKIYMQNIELNQLKSKLLPLLINGQLEV